MLHALRAGRGAHCPSVFVRRPSLLEMSALFIYWARDWRALALRIPFRRDPALLPPLVWRVRFIYYSARGDAVGRRGGPAPRRPTRAACEAGLICRLLRLRLRLRDARGDPERGTLPGIPGLPRVRLRRDSSRLPRKQDEARGRAPSASGSTSNRSRSSLRLPPGCSSTTRAPARGSSRDQARQPQPGPAHLGSAFLLSSELGPCGGRSA